jgi:hypothetical protein
MLTMVCAAPLMTIMYGAITSLRSSATALTGRTHNGVITEF